MAAPRCGLKVRSKLGESFELGSVSILSPSSWGCRRGVFLTLFRAFYWYNGPWDFSSIHEVKGTSILFIEVPTAGFFAGTAR